MALSRAETWGQAALALARGSCSPAREGWRLARGRWSSQAVPYYYDEQPAVDAARYMDAYAQLNARSTKGGQQKQKKKSGTNQKKAKEQQQQRSHHQAKPSFRSDTLYFADGYGRTTGESRR